jgi:hypothetical protein
MVVSDHGLKNGVHTETAYGGSNFAQAAKSILDVPIEIRGILNRTK